MFLYTKASGPALGPAQRAVMRLGGVSGIHKTGVKAAQAWK